MFPLEIDLDLVRRQREIGVNGLGQVLKSFRDRQVEFSVYDRASGADAYLQSLGRLAVPERGSRAGPGHKSPSDVSARRTSEKPHKPKHSKTERPRQT
jgi:hypothetical protein